MKHVGISVVTPCLNMAPYVEKTIRSIVEQEYPGLEYIVIDGGSTDGTAEIIQRFSKKISMIKSEKDYGQYRAIAKGMALSHGEVMAWLNADDLYYPWTLSVVGEIFGRFPRVNWIIGMPSFINEKGQGCRMSDNVACYPRPYIRNGWFRGHLASYLQQESMFWRRGLWEKAGGLDLRLEHAADFHLWTKFARYSDLVSVSVPLAAFRARPDAQKSSRWRDQYEAEVLEVCRELKRPPWLWDTIARRGVIPRSLCRFLPWKKGWVVAWRAETREWVLVSIRRPVSRASWAGLTLEYAIRRRGGKSGRPLG